MDAVRLSTSLANIESLHGMIEQVREDRRGQALQLLRNDIRIFDEYRVFQGYPAEVGMQTRLLGIVQSIAFRGFVLSEVSDVATWCLERWLRLVGENPRCVDVLRGVGEHWNLKAQAILRNAQPDSGSSMDSDDPEPRYRQMTTGHHSSEQVEARGFLIPAADYLWRAVEVAQATRRSDGSLLALAAECHISLGTITSGRESLGYLQAAVRFLRMADEIDDYELSDELERYLEDYGQYVD